MRHHASSRKCTPQSARSLLLMLLGMRESQRRVACIVEIDSPMITSCSNPLFDYFPRIASKTHFTASIQLYLPDHFYHRPDRLQTFSANCNGVIPSLPKNRQCWLSSREKLVLRNRRWASVDGNFRLQSQLKYYLKTIDHVSYKSDVDMGNFRAYGHV